MLEALHSRVKAGIVRIGRTLIEVLHSRPKASYKLRCELGQPDQATIEALERESGKHHTITDLAKAIGRRHTHSQMMVTNLMGSGHIMLHEGTLWWKEKP